MVNTLGVYMLPMPLLLLLLPQLLMLHPASAAEPARNVVSTSRRRLQPAAAACCFAGGFVELSRMPICDPPPGVRPLSSYRDLKTCWERAAAHFGNHTRVDPDGVNATVAETHPIFVVSLAAGSDIRVPPTEPPLTMDASLLPPGSIPVDEMLSFQLVVAYPFPARDGTVTVQQPCPRASISDLRLELTDTQHLRPHPLSLGFSGC
eukprot:COSAG06_NODE_14838_length_1121_cov_1.919765_1_plen_205_part_10